MYLLVGWGPDCLVVDFLHGQQSGYRSTKPSIIQVKPNIYNWKI